MVVCECEKVAKGAQRRWRATYATAFHARVQHSHLARILGTHSVVPRLPLTPSHCVPLLSRHAIQRSQRWSEVPEFVKQSMAWVIAMHCALRMKTRNVRIGYVT